MVLFLFLEYFTMVKISEPRMFEKVSKFFTNKTPIISPWGYISLENLQNYKTMREKKSIKSRLNTSVAFNSRQILNIDKIPVPLLLHILFASVLLWILFHVNCITIYTSDRLLMIITNLISFREESIFDLITISRVFIIL